MKKRNEARPSHCRVCGLPRDFSCSQCSFFTQIVKYGTSTSGEGAHVEQVLLRRVTGCPVNVTTHSHWTSSEITLDSLVPSEMTSCSIIEVDYEVQASVVADSSDMKENVVHVHVRVYMYSHEKELRMVSFQLKVLSPPHTFTAAIPVYIGSIPLKESNLTTWTYKGNDRGSN